MTAYPLAEWLGGRGALHRLIRSDIEMLEALEQGLPLDALDAVIKRGWLTSEDADRVVLPRRTLAYRRKQEQRLSPEESGRLARAARVIALAEETFADAGKAHVWMRRPNRGLGGRVPIELLQSEEGARLVDNVLGRITHGIYS